MDKSPIRHRIVARAGYPPCGDVAQLGERRVRNAKVVGSNPIVSIRFRIVPRMLDHGCLDHGYLDHG